MSTNFKGLIAGIAAGLLIGGGTPAIADDGPDEPISDAYATQDPLAYSGWVTKPCETERSVNCYWDAIGRTGQFGWSYWRIRVGHQVCVRFWDAQYNRRHGFCEPVRRERRAR